MQKESNWMAAEIDPSTLDSAFVQSMADKGYKVVHGVSFTDPRKFAIRPESKHVCLRGRLRIRMPRKSRWPR